MNLFLGNGITLENRHFTQFKECLTQADGTLTCFLGLFPQDKITGFVLEENGEFKMTFENECRGKLPGVEVGSISLAKTVEGQITPKIVSKGFMGGEKITRGSIKITSGVTVNIEAEIKIGIIRINPKSLSLKNLIINPDLTFCLDIKMIPKRATTMSITHLLNLKPQWN